jgi:hypothetical protein
MPCRWCGPPQPTYRLLPNGHQYPRWSLFSNASLAGPAVANGSIFGTVTITTPSPTSSFVTVDRAEAEAVPFSYATSGGGIPSIRGDPMAASHPQAYPAPPAATVPVNHSSIGGDSLAVSHPQTHPAPPATTVPVIHDHTRPPAEMRWYAVVRGLCPGVHQGW